MHSIVPVQKPSEQPGPPQKRCELQLFFAGIRQAVRRLKALHLGCLNMQFQQVWPKDKKLQLFNFFTKTWKFFAQLSVYHAPQEGSTIFFSTAPRAVLRWKAIE